MKKLWTGLLGLMLSLSWGHAEAQYNDASSDLIIQSSGSEIARLRNAGLLQLQSGVFLKAIADACDSTLLGVLRYNSTEKTAEFCNGTDWETMGYVAAATPPASTPENFFVRTSSDYYMNFGGLTNADAVCVSDLTSNDWMGKPAGYPTGYITKAFLCDGSSCNNLSANKEFAFARAGEVSTGGATFTTDATGAGPGDTNAWDGATYFNTTVGIASGRANGTDTAWSLSSHGTHHCNGLTNTTSSYNIRTGASALTTRNRWSNSNVSCASRKYMACFVEKYEEPTVTDNFFVMTSVTSTGNFGGIAAANATCETDLTNNDWMGKPAGYPTGYTTRAFLCDSSGCNNAEANTEYTFVRSGALTTGGDTFTTNASGLGPNDSEKWNVATKFGTTNENLWTGRKTANATRWAATADPYHCTDWTDGSAGGTGINGHLNDTSNWRWNKGTAACSQNAYFVCMVDPETTPATPEGNFFVMASDNSNGNFGGLAAADAQCETNLTSADWMGKPAGYPTGYTTKAFLCDGTTCNNLKASTEYTYAKAGNVSVGGDTFTTDGSGAGPGVTAAWNTSTTFSAGTNNIWSGRQGGSGTAWSLDTAGNHCSGWTDGSSGGIGRAGRADLTGASRWNLGAFQCATNSKYICIVDPEEPTGGTTSGDGYFVLSNDTYAGNVGSLAALDAACLTELQMYDWNGKSDATLTSSNVKAWLCDETNCNTLLANKNYKFARANSASSGGSFFTTDANGYGPNDSADWSGTTYFDSNQSYRANASTISGTQFQQIPLASRYSCASWTSNSAAAGDAGILGDADKTDNQRWSWGLGYCDNSYRMVCAVHPEPVADHSASAPSGGQYMVLTDTKWNGNMGGLSGADANCLTDLQANDWKGKSSVTLNSDTVKALLCDSTTCNELQANTTYDFALSNDASVGGHQITTDGSGQLVDSGNLWDNTTTFSTANPYWSNRASISTTTWANTPKNATSAGSCNDFTSSSSTVNSRAGKPNQSGSGRWDQTNRTCNLTARLLCAVDDPDGSGTGPASGSGGTTSGDGYFVLTDTKWDGNLGGLAGADAKCLTDLQANDWMGKSDATLDTNNVKAWLCDTSTCNSLDANVTYNYAVSNANSLGGDTFTTDGTGNFTTDGNSWIEPTRFGFVGVDAEYWSNRKAVGTTISSNNPDQTAASSVCSDWASTTGNGDYGEGHNSWADRFGSLSTACTNTKRLVCMVNP